MNAHDGITRITILLYAYAITYDKQSRLMYRFVPRTIETLVEKKNKKVNGDNNESNKRNKRATRAVCLREIVGGKSFCEYLPSPSVDGTTIKLHMQTKTMNKKFEKCARAVFDPHSRVSNTAVSVLFFFRDEKCVQIFVLYCFTGIKRDLVTASFVSIVHFFFFASRESTKTLRVYGRENIQSL